MGELPSFYHFCLEELLRGQGHVGCRWQGRRTLGATTRMEGVWGDDKDGGRSSSLSAGAGLLPRRRWRVRLCAWRTKRCEIEDQFVT
jgi:hypothetical protein